MASFQNYDLNYKVRQKDFEINELSIAVNDLRGKFVKPTLKKVSKTDSQFDKLKKKEASKVWQINPLTKRSHFLINVLGGLSKQPQASGQEAIHAGREGREDKSGMVEELIH